MEKRRMCPACRAFITTDDKTCPYCQVQVAPKAVERRASSDALGGLIPHARFVTMMILLVNTGLYLATVLHSSQSGAGGFDNIDGQTLFDFGAKQAPAILAGQWWRLLTAAFLHGNLIHILMNSWVLFDVGAQVEQNFGVGRYLVIYVISSITGFYASMYFAPLSLSVGASAPIFGLIGAMIALGVRDRSSYGAAVRAVYVRWAIFALLMSFLPGIDMWAHIGGLAGGFAIGFIAGTPGYSRLVERAWQVASGFALGLTGLAFFQMFVWLTSAK